MIARRICRRLSRKTNGGPLRSGDDIPLPPGQIFRALTRNGLIDDIGLLIIADQVRSSLRPIFFDALGNKYDDATIIANIQSSQYSQYLNCGLELVGDATRGYVLYPEGTGDDVLAKAYQYFRDTHVPFESDLAYLLQTASGQLYSPIVRTAYSAAAGNVPTGSGGVQSSASPPVYSDGFSSAPGYTAMTMFSNLFENAGWTKTGSTTVDSTTGETPSFLGGLVARKISFSAGSMHRYVESPANVINITRIRLKYVSGSAWYQIMWYDGGGNQCRCWVNIQTGALGTIANAGTATDTKAWGRAAGNGWFDIFVSGKVATEYGFHQISCRTADGSTTNADGIASACFAMVYRSAVELPYVETAGTNVAVVSTAGNSSGNGLSAEVTGGSNDALGACLGRGYTTDLLLGVFNDTHYSSAGRPGSGTDVLANVGTMVDNFIAANVDAIIGVGDTYFNDYADQSELAPDIETFESLFDVTPVPKVFALGNHEQGYMTDTLSFLPLSRFSKKNYVQDVLDDYRVIVFWNAEHPDFSASAETLVWLTAALNDARLASKKIILVAHVRFDQAYPGAGFAPTYGYLAGAATPSATTGTGITVDIAGYSILAGDVGRYIHIKQGTTWGSCRITAVVNANQVTADVVYDFASTAASDKWVIDGPLQTCYNANEVRAIVEDAQTAGASIMCVLHGHSGEYATVVNGIKYFVNLDSTTAPNGSLFRISLDGTVTKAADETGAAAYKTNSPAVVSAIIPIKFGASSSEIITDKNILTVNNAVAGLLYAASGGVIKCSDSAAGTASVTVSDGWGRQDIMSIYLSVSASALKVGYRKPAETEITWGDAIVPSGTFSPVMLSWFYDSDVWFKTKGGVIIADDITDEALLAYESKYLP